MFSCRRFCRAQLAHNPSLVLLLHAPFSTQNKDGLLYAHVKKN